jgi:ATP-dependent Clp protease protease subunit
MIKNVIFSTVVAFSGIVIAKDEVKITPAPEKSVLEVNKERLINILGPVNAGIVEKANDLMTLARISREPIYLFVNSPGGSVRAGNVFIDAMTIAKNRGIEIKCITSIYAASMAFSILANCSDRYVLPNARLLFHPARIGIMGAYTGPEYQELADILNNLDKSLQEFLVKELEIDRDVMMKAYYAEKWWDAKELQAATKKGWLIIVEDVIGIENLFSFKAGRVNQSDFLHELNEFGHVFFHTATN